MTAAPICYLGIGDAADVLRDVPAGSAPLCVSSPPYLGLIDYHAAARNVGSGRDGRIWHAGDASVVEYLDAMTAVMGQLHRVLARDAILALEVGDVRVPRSGGSMLPLPDWWLSLCEGFGFRLLERISLVRPLALGRRSGHFKRPAQNRPGYALLDTVSSTLLVMGRGDPHTRLRDRSRPADAIDVIWAERFLRSMWTTARPARTTLDRLSGHPVPSDAETVRALLRFYSCRGDLVVDPFAGSGTVGRIAAEEARSSLLVEREPPFAHLTCDVMQSAGVAIAPVNAVRAPRRSVLQPSAQLALPLPAILEHQARRAFLRSARGDITPRHREMAQRLAAECGVAVSPELVGLFLRVERAHVAAVGRARYGA
ncbi:MAG: site-specific DNA-methyltransferase [Gemmatimonadaceae bacterium]|nr:site-specific DNA-methyltransferase [Gemmatimonadaceae bacterium]